MAFFGEYLAIDPPKSFTWTFMFDVEGMGPMGGPEAHTLEDLGGRTRVMSISNMGSSEGRRTSAGGPGSPPDRRARLSS